MICFPTKSRYEPTHLEELVGSLLPLLGHGGRRGLGEGAHGSEDDEREEDTGDSVGQDLLLLAGRGESAGAVGTEGDVVGCVEREYMSVFLWSGPACLLRRP